MNRIGELLARPSIILALAILVLIAFVADPFSFARAWNQGRSALLAIIPLAILEIGLRGLESLRETKKVVAVYIVLALAACYYFAVSLPSVVSAIENLGVSLGVDPLLVHYSWVWGIDYAVTSILILGVIFVFSRPRPFTPLIYTLGMASFLFIDVILPYNSLGPFQIVVPPILQFVANILSATGLGSATAAGNILMLRTAAGRMNLQVFWPSAGLHGILIGLMVVAFVSIKLEVGWRRGLVYLLVGVVGSFIVNVFRIVLLAIYAMQHITDPKGFEVFHSVAGDLVFIPWIVVYVLLIIRHERRIAVRKRGQPSSSSGSAIGTTNG